MLESLTVFLLICLMCLLGVFTLALIILIITITLTLVPKTPKLCKKAISHTSRNLKVFVYWVLIQFHKATKLMLKISSFISTHRLLAWLFLYTLAIVSLFFYRFEFSFYSPLKNWESTAVYFNNMLSPVIIGITLFYIAKSFLEQKSFNSDILFEKSVDQGVKDLKEFFNQKPDNWLIEVLDKQFEKNLEEEFFHNNNELSVFYYENRIYFNHEKIPPFLYHRVTRILRSVKKLRNEDYQRVVFEEFCNSLSIGLLFMAYLQGLNVIENRRSKNKSCESDKDLVASLDNFLLQSSIASDFKYFKSFITPSSNVPPEVTPQQKINQLVSKK